MLQLFLVTFIVSIKNLLLQYTMCPLFWWHFLIARPKPLFRVMHSWTSIFHSAPFPLVKH